jgi:hypothetical protein
MKLSLQDQGFSTPDTIRHLGIELGPNMRSTISETLAKIDLKAAKRRILATAPPTDVLHRATLINSALIPLYNHVLMVLPAIETDLQHLYREVKSFLWTRTENDTRIQKRRLVAAKRLSASFDKGGLQIQHPVETAEGLRLNLLQKYSRKITNDQPTIFSRIITQILQRSGRPDLLEHINKMGPQEWQKTGQRISTINPMLGESFQSMANFLMKLEESQEDWHHSPIWGHSRTHKLFPFYPADIATLQTLRINTVSQIFETHLSGGIDKNISPELLTALQPYPALRHKLTLFAKNFQRMPFRNKYANPRTILASIIQLDTNMSRRNKLLCRNILDAEIRVAPAYHTRIRDNIQIRPTTQIFNNAFHLLRLPSLTSKTRETAFQILNRTTWTNNKAFKSRMRDNPNCERCGNPETMEHMVCECLHYAQPLWIKLGQVITKYLNLISIDHVPRVEYSQLNIIFNVPHPSLILHIPDKLSRNALLILTQEIKRDIIYRRMNLPPSANQPTDPARLTAHLNSTLQRLHSYLQYIGLAKYAKANQMLQKMIEINLEGS